MCFSPTLIDVVDIVSVLWAKLSTSKISECVLIQEYWLYYNGIPSVIIIIIFIYGIFYILQRIILSFNVIILTVSLSTLYPVPPVTCAELLVEDRAMGTEEAVLEENTKDWDTPVEYLAICLRVCIECSRYTACNTRFIRKRFLRAKAPQGINHVKKEIEAQWKSFRIS